MLSDKFTALLTTFNINKIDQSFLQLVSKSFELKQSDVVLTIEVRTNLIQKILVSFKNLRPSIKSHKNLEELTEGDENYAPAVKSPKNTLNRSSVGDSASQVVHANSMSNLNKLIMFSSYYMSRILTQLIDLKVGPNNIRLNNHATELLANNGHKKSFSEKLRTLFQKHNELFDQKNM